MRFLTPAVLFALALAAEIAVGPVAGLLLGILAVISWEACLEN